MRHDETDDELLRSYLLGKLPEEESERLERRLLAEDDLFELSEAVEADLLAACDRGELAAGERDHVLRRLASSPSGRERLALVRALNALAGSSVHQPVHQSIHQAAAAILPFKERAAAPPRPARYRWAALAAGVLVTAGLSWIALRPPHGGESARWIPREIPAPAHPVPQPAHGALAQATPPAPKPPEPVKAVFQLALASLRGAEGPEKLRIPAGATNVELQISVEGMDGLKSFQLAVRDRKAGTTVWKGALDPRALQGVRTLVIDLPADTLSPGTYEIEARGLAPGREPEELSPLDVVVVKDEKR